ncbi:MAG: hypothetical protein QS2022_7430 [Candidatus Phytoplasma asteris]|nr:MAG: putative secreted protein [Periwinkle leaf yellowing phytoplasma]WEX19955.1 MAG: hypothetical protein QS2022_7430 [Candidatus Phytoplasma asteris]
MFLSNAYNKKTLLFLIIIIFNLLLLSLILPKLNQILN